MATIDILRRRIEMAQAKADEYEGVVLGCIYTSPHMVTEGIKAVSPVIDLSNVTGVITIYSGTSDLHCLYWLTKTDGGNSIGYLKAPSGSLGLGSNQFLTLQFEFDIDNIDDVYVSYSGGYLFKGKNVT